VKSHINLREMIAMQEMTVKELAERIKAGTAPAIIDVREPDEYQYARIEGAVLKPLGGITRWAQELDQEQEYVLQCHTGVRSGQAAYLLERMGFKKVYNLNGGIDAWSLHIDPSVPRY
jgi:rhodanese-related sulfurtransferase